MKNLIQILIDSPLYWTYSLRDRLRLVKTLLTIPAIAGVI